MLYPGRMHLLRELARASEKPANLLPLASDPLATPSIASASRFIAAIEQFTTWPEPAEGRWNRFHRDRVIHWLAGSASLADCSSPYLAGARERKGHARTELRPRTEHLRHRETTILRLMRFFAIMFSPRQVWFIYRVVVW